LIIFKRKREKRKQIVKPGIGQKGNGIIGGDPLGEETVYAVVFCKSNDRSGIDFSCAFYPFRLKIFIDLNIKCHWSRSDKKTAPGMLNIHSMIESLFAISR
jgi:hypothetical protein